MVTAGPFSSPTPPQTLFDKIWQSHSVTANPDGSHLLYIDRHLLHEVTSPQPFAGLIQRGRQVRQPGATVAMVDHSISSTPVPAGFRRSQMPAPDPASAVQMAALPDNTQRFGITLFDADDPRNGIVHVSAPEQGLTLPGTTIVCGDSHTSTHGAFGALAFGIGTSEVEHVLATQCLWQIKPKTLAIYVNGQLPPGTTAKDLALHIIRQISADGGTGHVIEFIGDAIRALDMEGRMTLCNMAIEAGARTGMVAPDDTTFAYLKGRPFAPTGDAWLAAEAYWRTLPSDAGSVYDRSVDVDASTVVPLVTWGTSPAMVAGIGERVPDPATFSDPEIAMAMRRALDYMGLAPGTALSDIAIDRVFIGSCTNSRIADLRAAAAIVAGRRVAANVQALVVPGSGSVKQQAEDEGLADIFRAAGFVWGEPGCSMCVGMNGDRLRPQERCASTSNRNFEGRQGIGGRTHLVSPAMAAAAAIAGHFVDVRTWSEGKVE